MATLQSRTAVARAFSASGDRVRIQGESDDEFRQSGALAMKILSCLDPASPCFSFEFFPPKTPDGEKNLWTTLEDLRSLDIVRSIASVLRVEGGA